MKWRINKLVLSLVLLSFFIPTHQAAAETVEVCGVPLKFDQLALLDDQLLRVRVLEHEKIVKRSDLAEFVVDGYFSGPLAAQSISNLELQNLLSGCARAKQRSWFLKIFTAWSSREIDALSARQTLRSIIAEADGPELLSLAIKYDSLKQKMLEDLIQSDLVAASRLGKIEAIAQLASICKTILGPHNHLVRELETLNNLLLSFEAALKLAEVNSLQDLISRLEADPLVGEYNQEFVHRAAAALINKKDFSGALEILGYVDAAKRSPETHKLVIQALSELEPSLQDPLAQSRTSALLWEIAKNDAAAREQLLSVADQQVLFYLENERTDLAENLLLQIVQLRADPSTQNDQLRFKTALLYQDRGLTQAARDELGKMRTGIGILQRIRALFAGIYMPLYWILLVFVLPLAVVGIVVLKHRNPEQQAEEVEIETEPEQETPAGFSYAGKRRARNNPLVQEYAQGLKRLGLAESASFKEIKNAYRKLVKTLHPDSAKGKTEQDADEFIKLNKLYERLLEIRRSLGLPNED